MTAFKDYIVVEFDLAARFLVKSTLLDFNTRKIEEFQGGHLNPNKYVVAVYEKELHADEFIDIFQKDPEFFIKAILKGNEQPF